MTTARREKGWGQPSRFIGFYRVKLVRPWESRWPINPLPASSAWEKGLAQTCPPRRFQVTAAFPGQGRAEMKIDRRSFLLAAACLAMAKLVGPTCGQPRPSGSDEPPWHPFTLSLLDRARQASLVDGRANTALIE